MPAGAFVATAVAFALAGVHLFSGRLHALDRLPRSWTLSFAGGISVAYVFVHVLPEVTAAGRHLEARYAALETVEGHAHLLALAGFVGFYGLERFVRRRRATSRGDATPMGVFWVHVGSFAVYNGLIGYLLFHREAPGVGGVLLFGGAMGAHFLVNDFGLRHDHERTYARVGRWVLAGSVLGGAAVGAATHVPPALLGIPYAVLAGGVVLNVIKEELPAERESRFGAFALGAGGNAVLLLLV